MIIVFLIAISVSIDAFSLALLYGTKPFNCKDICKLSFLVGTFHFFMPLIGITIGNIIINYINLPISLTVFLIFTLIGIEMLKSTSENQKQKLDMMEHFLFAFTVSVDSFTVGLVLFKFTHHYLFASIIFFLSSFAFTYGGLMLGKKINQKLGIISTKIGGLILIMIGLFNFFHLF
ncbi:MAG: manganese efflux pump [Bacilli bacterium]|nr:manganese efflux pump [Bacilli bacterium]